MRHSLIWHERWWLTILQVIHDSLSWYTLIMHYVQKQHAIHNNNTQVARYEQYYWASYLVRELRVPVFGKLVPIDRHLGIDNSLLVDNQDDIQKRKKKILVYNCLVWIVTLYHCTRIIDTRIINFTIFHWNLDTVSANTFIAAEWNSWVTILNSETCLMFCIIHFRMKELQSNLIF